MAALLMHSLHAGCAELFRLVMSSSLPPSAVCPFILGNEFCERLAFYGWVAAPGFHGGARQHGSHAAICQRPFGRCSACSYGAPTAKLACKRHVRTPFNDCRRPLPQAVHQYDHLPDQSDGRGQRLCGDPGGCCSVALIRDSIKDSFLGSRDAGFFPTVSGRNAGAAPCPPLRARPAARQRPARDGLAGSWPGPFQVTAASSHALCS